MIGLGYESIHACVNDCFLFRGDANKDVHFCPVCNTSRWKDSNTPGKKVPKKVLRYFSIIPKLQRLYKSSHTVKEMTWHATEKCMDPGKMQHPVDGRVWKDFGTKYSDFAAEPRNTINDLPARSSLSGWSGQGYRACPKCIEDTPSVRVLGKIAYVSHRRFLKKPHKWR
ncbi:zinc finger, PHD-type containing protein, partial [Tanacetum coccineum]